MNKDKIYHQLVGAGIVILTTMAMFVIFGIPAALGIAVLYVAIGRLLAGWAANAKEAYDEARPLKHTADMLDAAVTEGGANLASAIILILLVIAYV